MSAGGIEAKRRRQALWVALFWVVVGVASFVLGVQSTIGQQAEASVLDAARFTTDPPAPLNLVSVPSVAISLLAVGALAWGVHGFRRGIGVLTVSLCVLAASQLLKLRLLTRPGLFELDAPNTFPSGHMTFFAVLVAALIWAVPAQMRGLVMLGGSVLLSAVGWQLLAYGWHRPSDVFGAIALCVSAFAVATVVKPATSRGSAQLGRTLSIGMAVVGWGLVLAALVFTIVAAANTSQALMLDAGQLAAAAASTLASRSLFLLSNG